MKIMLLTLSSLIVSGLSLLPAKALFETKKIDTEASTITWKGKKVTGQHSGNIQISSGTIEVEDGILKGGEIIIDMASITCTDLDKKGAQKLIGHLKSDDFFAVPHHPTASFVITKVNDTRIQSQYQVTGDMTIKGITQPVTFVASISTTTLKAVVAIDRTHYNITYGSGSFFDNLGDRMIYDEFELEMSLTF